MKKVLTITLLAILVVGAQAQPWGNRVEYLTGWVSGASSPITTVGSDSAYYVYLGSIGARDYIHAAYFHTETAWTANAPADSACIGTSSDIDAIVNETTCQAVGQNSSTVLAAAQIYSLTQEQSYGPIYGYKRITSDAAPLDEAGKTFFVVLVVRGRPEPD